ncbi:phospholipase B domain containing 1 [Reticulomyxa filosa]|uniref:Phospholipase B-like n=1 Tax=Reticulomyxa filosa TaxID=46433 RepID=X6M702_RETFI|nr:phospholipase B domain containing 1 [Reticulomyxa filosa]|eukprot:ETO09376.1 phospholipase B domain containing 1 [Reticulomyxa filosa]
MRYDMKLISALYLLLVLTWGEEHSFNGTVYYNATSNTYKVKLGVIDCTNGVACGYFDDALNRTGMGVLEIQTQKPSESSKITDYNRMYGAGYLEGYLSCYEIYWSYYAGWMNVKPSLEPFMTELQNWTSTQKAWINDNIEKYSSSDPLWQYTELLMGQFYGVKDGYNAAIEELNTGLPPLDEFAFDFINANEEWPDVVQAINDSMRVDWFAFKTSKQALNHRLKSGHCSGLIKVTPELDDIIFSHSTWFVFYVYVWRFQYWWMNRVYKIYSFELEMDIPTSRMVMSSC